MLKVPKTKTQLHTAGWSSANAFVSGAGGLKFKSWAGQIHRCDISSKEAVFPERNDAEMAPQTRYTLRRNTASIMKNLILI